MLARIYDQTFLDCTLNDQDTVWLINDNFSKEEASGVEDKYFIPGVFSL